MNVLNCGKFVILFNIKRFWNINKSCLLLHYICTYIIKTNKKKTNNSANSKSVYVYEVSQKHFE